MISYDGPESFLTVNEVAELLHIHPNTLRRWSDEGRIVSYRITFRGDRRFKPSDVNNFISGLNHHERQEQETH